MPASLLTIVMDDPEESIRRVVHALRSTQFHSLYISPIHCGTVHAYGERLAAALAAVDGLFEPQSLSSEEASSLRGLRGSYSFRAGTDPRVSLHASEALEGWTVISEEDSLFALSGGPRQLYVKPIPDHWEKALFFIRPQLQEAAVWPFNAAAIKQLQSTVGIGGFRSL